MLVNLLFTFGSLLEVNGFSLAQIALPRNALFSLIIILLSPIAGGFVAGLIAQENPQQAGLIAGLTAGLVVSIAWMAMVGIFWETLISGLVVVFERIFFPHGGWFCNA